MAAFGACACKLSWTLLFDRPGSAPIWGGKKGEFRDWTRFVKVSVFVSSYMDHTGGLRDYLERNNCNEL